METDIYDVLEWYSRNCKRKQGWNWTEWIRIVNYDYNRSIDDDNE